MAELFAAECSVLHSVPSIYHYRHPIETPVATPWTPHQAGICGGPATEREGER